LGEILMHEETNMEEVKRRPGRPRKIPAPVIAQSSPAPQMVPFDPLMFAKAVGDAIAQSIPQIAAAMRESSKDPEKERIKHLRRMQTREEQKENRKADVDKWLSCDHMRTHPYSGTARIGWATQSDGHTRGTCMGCGCPFTPIESELPDPERMRHLYTKYRNVPVTVARNDFVSGMVVAGNPA
jgi:hypothetical protein